MTDLPPDPARMQAEHIAGLSAADAAADVAALRRSFVIEALDGMIWQATAIVRFLERADDGCAEAAMGRMFDLARKAAPEMKALRGEVTPNTGALEAQ